MHTHPQTRIFFAQISCKRHFFRSSANKEIFDLKAIRRAALRIASFIYLCEHELPPFAADDSPTFSFDREIMSKKHLARDL